MAGTEEPDAKWFFRPGPSSVISEAGANIETLYFGQQHLHLAGDTSDFDPVLFDVAALQNQALRAIHDGFDALVEPHLFNLTTRALLHAIDTGFGTVAYNSPTRAFVDGLQVSIAHFSARKSYQQMRDLAALLDDNGTRRSWRDFKRLAGPIVGNYNERWLKVEFDTASRACRVAAELKKWSDPDHARLYPNLRYLASRAAIPRDEHKPFYGVVRPINDDFWTHHLPPSTFNCQCGVEPVDDDVTPLPEDQPAPTPGLDNNPAQSGTVFNLTNPNGPYYPATSLLDSLDSEGARLLVLLLKSLSDGKP